jgi:cytochrome c oxidase cbb3-type subunit III
MTAPGGWTGRVAWVASLLIAIPGAACHRETRDLRPSPAGARFSAGTLLAEMRASEPLTSIEHFTRDYQENAYAMNEGKRLFAAYNCTGCHAHGGGAIGPALMDDRWIYGAAPADVFATIIEGRPNGMPAFRGKIADFQVGQLVAYVRSMSGLAGKISAPGRNDEMQVEAGENRRDRHPPVGEGARQLP